MSSETLEILQQLTQAARKAYDDEPMYSSVMAELEEQVLVAERHIQITEAVKQRSEFEEIMTTNPFFAQDGTPERDREGYADACVHGAWISWKAARYMKD